MGKLEEAVVLTKKYAAFFGGGLSDTNLHRWLISGKTYSPQSLKKLFPQKVKSLPNYSEAKKFALARKVTKLLSFVPTISTIAITGSLAINNSKPGDDIDLMIVTAPNSLWLTRLFVIPLVGLFFKRRLPATGYLLPATVSDSICLNLWLDESALAVPKNKRNLYTAHEVLQALPIYDRHDTYLRFIKANSWTKKYLANAYKYATTSVGGAAWTNFSRTPNWLIRVLNTLAFKLQYLYMKKRITHETVTLHAAYFHPRDLSVKLSKHLGIY